MSCPDGFFVSPSIFVFLCCPLLDFPRLLAAVLMQRADLAKNAGGCSNNRLLQIVVYGIVNGAANFPLSGVRRRAGGGRFLPAAYASLRRLPDITGGMRQAFHIDLFDHALDGVDVEICAGLDDQHGVTTSRRQSQPCRRPRRESRYPEG